MPLSLYEHVPHNSTTGGQSSFPKHMRAHMHTQAHITHIRTHMCTYNMHEMNTLTRVHETIGMGCENICLNTMRHLSYFFVNRRKLNSNRNRHTSGPVDADKTVFKSLPLPQEACHEALAPVEPSGSLAADWSLCSQTSGLCCSQEPSHWLPLTVRLTAVCASTWAQGPLPPVLPEAR